jgi:hypothetical protein
VLEEWEMQAYQALGDIVRSVQHTTATGAPAPGVPAASTDEITPSTQQP